MDKTWVKVGGKEAWIYAALWLHTLKVVYLAPLFVRDRGNTNAFLKHLVEAYGQWPKKVITDGGPRYRAAFSFWQVEGKIRWRAIRGRERSMIEGFFGKFLKLRIKNFDCYFPTKGLDSLKKNGFDPSLGSTTPLQRAVFNRASLG